MFFPNEIHPIYSGPRPHPGANVVYVRRPPHIPAGTVQRVDHITGQSSWHFPGGVNAQDGTHTNQGSSPFPPEVAAQLAKIPLPPLPDTPATRLLQPSQTMSLPDEWACKKCTFDNPLGVTHCSMCDYPKDTIVATPPQQVFWRCHACTFINTGSGSGSTCETCKCPYFDNQEEQTHADAEEPQSVVSQMSPYPTRSYAKTFFDYVKTLNWVFFCIVLIVSILLF
jgi:hypothetical protein